MSYRPTRKLQEANPPFDADLLFELASHFSPTVCWRQDQHQGHAGWLVEVHSSFRLFGGPDALLANFWKQLEELDQKLNNLKLDVQLNMANCHSATGAWWLSKCSPAKTLAEFIQMLEWPQNLLLKLPMHVLDVDARLHATWEQCGFSFLGDLQQLPRDGFLKRFGPLALAELDSGFGFSSRLAPIDIPHHPAEIFEQSLDMPFHSTRMDMIEHHAQILLSSLCSWLKAKKQGSRELLWTFHQAHAQHTLQLRSAQASCCEKTWQRLLHHQLGRMDFQDDIRSLRLECLSTEAMPDHTDSLLPDPAQASRNWESTCDLLRARLGDQTVLYAATECDPRPECSIILHHTPIPPRMSVLSVKQTSRQALEAEPAALPLSKPRPLWLLPAPRKLQTSPGWQSSGPWQLLTGPERVEFGWWDSQPCKRDYYCARDSQNSLVWLFQDLLDDSGAWFLHGYFS